MSPKNYLIFSEVFNYLIIYVHCIWLMNQLFVWIKASNTCLITPTNRNKIINHVIHLIWLSYAQAVIILLFLVSNDDNTHGLVNKSGPMYLLLLWQEIKNIVHIIKWKTFTLHLVVLDTCELPPHVYLSTYTPLWYQVCKLMCTNSFFKEEWTIS